jgi:TM2 domain-containing membrane protein YozV
MTGQVLDFSIQTNEGIISGDDSQRYRFAGADWPGGSTPVRGTLVDFDIAEGNRATSIYLVEPIASPAVPQTASARPVSPQSAPQATTGGKVRTTAAILALVLGGLGVHKFYLGEMGKGILYFVLAIFIFTMIISIVMALIDAIKLFQMTDADFDRQYNGGA